MFQWLLYCTLSLDGKEKTAWDLAFLIFPQIGNDFRNLRAFMFICRFRIINGDILLQIDRAFVYVTEGHSVSIETS